METIQKGATHTFACRSCKSPIEVGPEHRTYQFWTARCPNCGLQVEERLPAIQKKIIYLDQFVLSNIIAGKQERWEQIYNRLRLLSYLQVVACPYSEIHQDESLVAEHTRDDLKALYRKMSDGLSFQSTDWIQQVQLRRSIRQFLEQPCDDDGRYSDCFKADPNRWTLDSQVYADFSTNRHFVDRMNLRKELLQDALDTEAEEWRKENGRKLEQDAKREAVELGRSMMSVYREFDEDQQRLESMMPDGLSDVYRHFTGGGKFNPDIPPSTKPFALLVHMLAGEVHKARPGEADPVAVVEHFLASDEAIKNTPFLSIMSRLRAGIIGQVRNPKGARSPKASDENDIAFIAHFAPYCDAMIVDNHFRGLASQVGVERDHGVAIYSPKTLDAFIIYLDELLHTIPHKQRLAITHVIPGVSRFPFLSTHGGGET